MLVFNTDKINEFLQLDLSRMSFKLFIFCLANSEKQQRLPGFTQNYIAEKIGVHRQQISRSFKELTENGVLIKKNRDYYLNPELFINPEPSLEK